MNEVEFHIVRPLRNQTVLGILTIWLALLGKASVLGHCPDTGLVNINDGIANVQNPATHGTTTPTLVIQLR